MSRHLRLLGDAAKVVDARSTRSRQRKVGASEIGVCRRRAGYKHHGHPVTNPENVTGLPAVLGTWVHKGALGTMRREWGSVIEVGVEDELVRGHVDAIELPNDWRIKAGLPEHPEAPDVVEVDDLKTKRDARMVDYVRNRGPKRSELFQPHLYAKLLREGKVQGHKRFAHLAALGPLPVETIRLRYFPRTGEEDSEYVYEQPFDDAIAEEAWEWVEQVAASSKPEDLPRDEDGPGLSVSCDHCPFVTACWGEASGVLPQAQLIVTDADLALTLAEYDEARVVEREAAERKALARAKLDATTPAIYLPGSDAVDGFKVAWSGGSVSDPKVNLEELLERFHAMQELYRQAGLEPPEVPYHDAKASPRTIRLTRWQVPSEECGKPVGDPEAHPYAAEDRWWVQNRPRSGWTGYEDPECAADETAEELTAGQFAKRFPDYVEPRPPCVLKAKHSGDCADADAIHRLDVDFDTEPAEADAG